MAYNSYYDIEKIVGLKGAYDEAKKRNDQQAMNNAASSAQQYYNSLIKNNYGDVANQLKNSGYADAQKIKTAAGTKGKTAIRPYYYNLGKQYGMSQSDIDKALGFNKATGEVTLGGKNIGTPYANVDGTTYWDSDKLDNVWNDYVEKMGITKTPEVRYNQGMENIQKKLDSTYDLTNKDHDNMNKEYSRLLDYGYSNPYDTDIADSIMEDYKWKGAKASNEAIASGGGSNGGNIDSYSAANASRQQLAFTNAGKAAILEDYNNRISNIRSVISDLGNYNQGIYNTQHQNIQLDMTNNQRVFDNNETQKMNDFNREAQMAEITGYVPQSWSDKNNPFLDEYGNPINADGMNYQAIINEAQSEYERTGDTGLLKTIEYATAARNKKINGNFDKYGQYSGNMRVPVQKTASVSQADANRESNERIALDTNYTSRYNTNSNNDAIKYQSDNAYKLGELQSNNELALGKHKSDNTLAGIKDTNAKNLEETKYTTDKSFDLQQWLAEKGFINSDNETSKPKISFDKAKELYDSGVYTDEVLYAMNYYAGITPDVGPEEAMPSYDNLTDDKKKQVSKEYKKLYNDVYKLAKSQGTKNIKAIPQQDVVEFIMETGYSDETKAKFIEDLGYKFNVFNAPSTAENSQSAYTDMTTIAKDVINTALRQNYNGSDKNPKSIPKMLVKSVVSRYNLTDDTKSQLENYFDVKL